MIIRVAMLFAVIGAAVQGIAKAQGQEKTPMENLIADLASDDGMRRVAATTEIFRRGKAVLPDLKKAGAKQVAPVGASVDGTRRLDIVYSVLEGFPPNQPKALAGTARIHSGCMWKKERPRRTLWRCARSMAASSVAGSTPISGQVLCPNQRWEISGRSHSANPCHRAEGADDQSELLREVTAGYDLKTACLKACRVLGRTMTLPANTEGLQ